MPSLTSKLEQKIKENPDSSLLQEVLSHLKDGASQQVQWDVLRRDFNNLVAEGLWEATEENDALLESLRQSLERPEETRTHENLSQNLPGFANTSNEDIRPANPRERDLSIVIPPPISAPLLPVSSLNPTVLPIELVDILNKVYFSHLLATDPAKVLPPGKSLLSMLSSPSSQPNEDDEEAPTLKHRVQDLVHRAFWDEAKETLSNPAPSAQLPRLQRFYEDLYVALKPLLPSGHPILVTLSSPMSPTSSPLRLAVSHLREILACLRERCAPVRDARIDGLVRGLDEASTSSHLEDAVVSTVRSLLDLADLMKEDLSQFTLGQMSEKQLKVVIAEQAATQERALILDLWPPARIEEEWRSWLAEYEPSMFRDLAAELAPNCFWILRLVEALGSTVPISCPLPTRTVSSEPQESTMPLAQNILPPPFFFDCPALLYTQNILQALVIAASLRSLVRLPTPPLPPTQPQDHHSNFTARIWTLLTAEINEEPGAGDTKLVNLADEVVRVRRVFSACDAEEEARLRAAVDRTLQPRDPVFLLLQTRLLRALAVRLCEVREAGGPSAPVRLEAGMDRPGKRPRLMLPVEADGVGERVEGRVVSVKGFEDEVLVKAVGDVFDGMGGSVGWVRRVWGDVVGEGRVVVP